MKNELRATVLAVLLCLCSASGIEAAVINPTSDGSLYVCDGCSVVADGDYVLVAGDIQGALKFASGAITGAVTQALLSLNPYGLPLGDLSVDVYGYGSANGQLEEADANEGSFLGTLTFPPDLAYGQDVFFDATAFVRSVSAPFIAFNLRSDDTNVFSSLEYNYGHPSQLWVTTTLAVSEPPPLAVLSLVLVVVLGSASPHFRKQSANWRRGG